MEERESFKKILESAAYEEQRAIINREINSKKVVIDRSVFKKSPKEKALLFNLKQEWKLAEARKK